MILGPLLFHLAPMKIAFNTKRYETTEKSFCYNSSKNYSYCLILVSTKLSFLNFNLIN